MIKFPGPAGEGREVMATSQKKDGFAAACSVLPCRYSQGYFAEGREET
jgi:hypothetical protein